jgi:hypothetical protein
VKKLKKYRSKIVSLYIFIKFEVYAGVKESSVVCLFIHPVVSGVVVCLFIHPVVSGVVVCLFIHSVVLGVVVCLFIHPVVLGVVVCLFIHSVVLGVVVCLFIHPVVLGVVVCLFIHPVVLGVVITSRRHIYTEDEGDMFLQKAGNDYKTTVASQRPTIDIFTAVRNSNLRYSQNVFASSLLVTLLKLNLQVMEHYL